MEECYPKLGIDKPSPNLSLTNYRRWIKEGLSEEEIEKKKIETEKAKFKKILDRFVRIAVGKTYSKKFCDLLLTHGPKDSKRFMMYKVPDSREKIYETLKNAIWLEEEDIRQHLLMEIWRFRIDSSSKLNKAGFFILRDYIFKQKVFINNTNWRDKYSSYLEDVDYFNEKSKQIREMNINNFKYFNGCKLDIYHQYLLYCLYGLDISEKNICKMVLETSSIFQKDIKELKNILKELYYGD